MSRLPRRALIPAWRARVTDGKEKGEGLIIRGRVLRSKGGPPASGMTIMVYQTDAAGFEGYVLRPRKDAQGKWVAAQDFAWENP